MTLLDSIRRIQRVAAPIVRRLLPPELTTEVSADDSTSSGELITPRDEVLQTHGAGDYTIYEKLLTDDQVQPCFRQRRTEVIAREWKVDPGGDAPLDKEAAEDLQRQMTRLGWDRTTYRMLCGLMYGFNAGECMYSIEAGSGKVLLDRIMVRRAARFRFASADRKLRLMKKGQPLALPDQKFWTFACGSENDDDPYGTGLGPSLYWPVWLKRNGLKFWSQFLERFANPTPKGVVPPGTTEVDRNKLMALLRRITNGGVIVVVPRGIDVELLQAVRSSGGDFEQFCTRLDAAIAKIILLQTMTTDNGSSLSQSETHYKVLTAGAKTDSDLIDESFTMGPARWLTQWNYPGAATPIVYRDFSSSVDTKATAETDNILNQMGWRARKEYIATTYGDNYDYVAPAVSTVVGTDTGSASFAEVARTVPTENPFSTPNGWRVVMGPEVQRIEALLADCRNMADVKKKLGDLATENPDELTEALARMMFAAGSLGDLGGEIR